MAKIEIDWDGIGRAISDTADAVGRKTGEVMETAKLKNQIYNLQRENRKDLEELGKLLYARYKEAGTIEPAFLAICEEIAGREILIDEYQGEIDSRKKEN